MDKDFEAGSQKRNEEQIQDPGDVVKTDFFSGGQSLGLNDQTTTNPNEEAGAEPEDDCPKAAEPAGGLLKAPSLSNEKIFEYFKLIKTVITEENLPYMDDWRRAFQAYVKSDFLVAVVGEFSTGKSTLINKMLDTDILPVGNLPTTAMLTRISYGTKNALTFIAPDSAKQELDFSGKSFDKFTAGLSGTDPEGVLEVKIDHSQLKPSGVYLFDTPGAGDVVGHRAGIIVNVLTQCDGAIFTIAADKPLSATEKAFMQQYVIAQRTPHICVILTKLDLLDPANQINMVKYVSHQIKKISSGIEFVVAAKRDTLPDGIDDLAKYGTDALWEIVNQWAVCKENADLKIIRAQAQLQELISKIEEQYLLKIQVLQLDETKCNEIMNELQNKLSTLKLAWTDIEIEIDKCRITFKNWIYQTMDSYQKDLMERFKLEIFKINDPKIWFENDFPYRLRTDVNNMAKVIEGNLQKRFYSDVNRISEFIKNKLQTSLILHDNPNNLNYQVDKSIFTDPAQQKLASLNKLRWAMRIGTGVATFGSYLIFAGLGPVGILAGTASALISEKIIGGKIEKQRMEVLELLNKTVNKVFSDALAEIDSKTQRMYKDVAEEIYHAEIVWLKEQQKIIEQKSHEMDPATTIQGIKVKLGNIEKMKLSIN